MSKVIITCAVTGSVHTPSMSPYLPITPDEIVADAVAAAEAGAAMIHLHARDPKTGKPTPSPEIFGQFLSRIRSEEHTSELQSLMRISYAVFCLKKKNKKY